MSTFPSLLARRQFLLIMVGTGAALAVPVTAIAASPSYFGRGFAAGGFR